MSISEPTPESVRPRFRQLQFGLRNCLTPSSLVLVLLAVEVFLFLSGRFCWFAFNEREGWTVLIAVAAAGAAIILLLAWFAAGLIFRLRFQFTLRSLLVLVIVVALPCNWFAAQMRQANRQRDAIRAIRQLGGRVNYDFEYPPVAPGESSSRPTRPPGPAWLRNLLGTDFLAVVAQVTLDAASNGRFMDEDMPHLQALPGLQHLDIDNPGVSDLGLEQLKGLSRLRKLSLSGAQFTDVGIKRLRELPALEELDLWGTQITDVGLQSLNESATLTRLRINSTRITAESEQLFQQALPNRRIDHWISPE